jgi:hypothetical protein
MTLKIILELALGIVLLVMGAGFWAIIKSPYHMKSLLLDRNELRTFIDYLGSSKLIQEALSVEPVFGSYLQNITLFEKTHIISLAKTRNLLIALLILIVIVSYFMGIRYAVINLLIFCLPAIFPIPASAKNNNVTHLHTVIINLYKWHITDSAACEKYCTQENPSLQILYHLVTELR